MTTIPLLQQGIHEAYPPVEPDSTPPEFSDEALALRFAERHADNLRFVAAWSKWFWFTGTKWSPDETLMAFDAARAICREEAPKANMPRHAAAIASAKTVASVVGLSKSDRRLAATVDQWDADKMLLNTPENDEKRGELAEKFRGMLKEAIAKKSNPVQFTQGTYDAFLRTLPSLLAGMFRAIAKESQEHAREIETLKRRVEGLVERDARRLEIIKEAVETAKSRGLVAKSKETIEPQPVGNDGQ